MISKQGINFNQQKLNILPAIQDLQFSYLSLICEKACLQQLNKKQLMNKVFQYQDLLHLIQKLSKCSVELYKNIVLLKQKREDLRLNANQRHCIFNELNLNYQSNKQINNQTKLSNIQKVNYINNQRQSIIKSQQKINNQKLLYHQNVLKLNNIQNQINFIQSQRIRLKGIFETARKDNQNLNKFLDEKIIIKTHKSIALSNFINQKNLLTTQKQIKTLNLKQNLSAFNQHKKNVAKEYYMQQKLQQQLLKINFSINKQKNQSYMISNEASALDNDLKSRSAQSDSLKNQLVNSLNFISQYNLLNEELILQMRLFIRNQIRCNDYLRQDKTIQLKIFLDIAEKQIKNSRELFGQLQLKIFQ